MSKFFYEAWMFSMHAVWIFHVLSKKLLACFEATCKSSLFLWPGHDVLWYLKWSIIPLSYTQKLKCLRRKNKQIVGGTFLEYFFAAKMELWVLPRCLWINCSGMPTVPRDMGVKFFRRYHEFCETKRNESINLAKLAQYGFSRFSCFSYFARHLEDFSVLVQVNKKQRKEVRNLRTNYRPRILENGKGAHTKKNVYLLNGPRLGILTCDASPKQTRKTQVGAARMAQIM